MTEPDIRIVGWHGRALRAETERDRYRDALERLMEFGKGLMDSKLEDERSIGCCICEV